MFIQFFVGKEDAARPKYLIYPRLSAHQSIQIIRKRCGNPKQRGSRNFCTPEAKDNCQIDHEAWATSQFIAFILVMIEAGVIDSEMHLTFSNVLNDK